MNRYLADGILVDIAQGKTVLIACASAVEMRESFRLLAGAADGLSSVRVCRSNGNERVESLHSGGVAMFRFAPASMRGLSPHVCFLDHVNLAGESAAAINPMLTGGTELVRA